VAEPRLDDLDPQLRELLDEAAANTVAPTPFDAAPALAAGHRRRARRRAAGGAGLAAVCLVSAAALLPGAGGRDAAPPAHDPTPSPTASPPVASDAQQSAERAMLARVLADENGFYGLMDFATGRVAAAVQRSCDEHGACDSALLTTLDGWHSGTSHLVPGVTVDWLHSLPDGSTVFTTDDPDDSVTLLLPDGTTSVEVTVSARPADAGAGDQIVTAPPALVDQYGPDITPVWVLNAEARTLSPLRGGPLGWPTGSVQETDDGTLVMSLTADRGGQVPAQVIVATSDDHGRTWRSTTVTADAASLPGFAVVGPDGRMALPFTFDGATISPLAELWTSRDTGRTWRRTRLAHPPRYYTGVAYADDGSLLLSDDQSGGLWHRTPDGTGFALDTDLPAADWLSLAGRRLVVGTADDLQVSSDGLRWDSLHWNPSDFPPNIRH
jgi:hypothetical protein